MRQAPSEDSHRTTTVEGLPILVDDRDGSHPPTLGSSIWIEPAKLTASSAGAWEYFGGSVSLPADTAGFGGSLCLHCAHDCTVGG